MAEIVGFVPAPAPEPDVVTEEIAEDFDCDWNSAVAGFQALRDRVETPRRRNGGPVQRCGPAQYFLGRPNVESIQDPTD